MSSTWWEVKVSFEDPDGKGTVTGTMQGRSPMSVIQDVLVPIHKHMARSAYLISVKRVPDPKMIEEGGTDTTAAEDEEEDES